MCEFTVGVPHIGDIERGFILTKINNLFLVKRLFDLGYDVSNIDYEPENQNDWYDNREFFINLVNKIGGGRGEIDEYEEPDAKGQLCYFIKFTYESDLFKRFVNLMDKAPNRLKKKCHDKLAGLLNNDSGVLYENVLNDDGLFIAKMDECCPDDFEAEILYMLKLFEAVKKMNIDLERKVKNCA